MDGNEKSVLIAMSGGVDSSVAAFLMQRSGYECTGATMKLYRSGPDGEMRMERDIEDARSTAGKLGIPFLAPDLSEDFKRLVVDDFVREYESGRTPNPCVVCNRTMKFGKLMEIADGLGIRYLATGHYARTSYDPERKRYVLRKGTDPLKDQSYMLYGLSQEQLSRVIFPLGGMTKTEVREIASRNGLPSALRRDSQDICFIPGRDYVSFLEEYTGNVYQPGNFVDSSGNVLGTHRGAVRYTIGQRRGLGISEGERMYVLGKDMKANTVTLGKREEVFSIGAAARNVNWVSVSGISGPRRVGARIRYSSSEIKGTAEPMEDGVRVIFDEPQKAVTPGQSLVMYDGDEVLGGGIITEPVR
ncbi:MAG: tRNA 2-thiouridine(34) synthase MnmA [Oscillospiraceae bacterium]|jgi:tRNA-specific 2-thiouridylase